MATYPTEPKPEEVFTTTHTDEMIVAEFEAGYKAIRPRWHKKRSLFKNRYVNITEAEKNNILDFLENNRGKRFDYIHPLTGTTYSVIFLGEVTESIRSYDRYELEVDLEEVF